MLNFWNLKFSAHAVTAMAERDVEVETIAAILVRPDIVEAQPGHRRRFVGQGLAIVVAGDDENPVVVTVLLRREEQWTDQDVRDRD